ncbi:MAG: reverse transcriptase domain-containing protein [Cyanobacteria bacterium J06635_10]
MGKPFQHIRCETFRNALLYNQTISTEPVNFARHYSTAEGRGLVVPINGKAAKSVDEVNNGVTVCTTQDTAHLNQRSATRVSSNDEQDFSRSVSESLNKLRRMGEECKHPINNLMKIIGNFDLWLAAYAKLSRNPGSLTKGTDGRTIDGTSVATLKALQEKTLTGSYQWGSIRRKWIPKPGRTEKRPLGIPNFQDRVVQEVLRMILDAIYEPNFLDCSHGFRPKRGQQGCVKYIRAWFPGVLWYIEGDISKCFDTIDHKILVRLLKKRIKDRKFIGLVESGLKCTIIDLKTSIVSELGTPQGGVLSPLLSNIYMHELDRYMTRAMLKINKGKRRKANLEYQKLMNRAYRARKRGDIPLATSYGEEARQLNSKDPMDPEYRRVRYVRFADDFLVGVIGPKAAASRLKEAINNYLRRRLKLKLNIEKTNITHHESRIPWLGFLVSTSRTVRGAKARLESKTIPKRIPALGVTVYSDINKILGRLAQKGYCQKDGTSLPNWKEALLPPQSYSTKRASQLIVGLDSYYKVANNRRATTHRVMRTIRNSLAKTFAAKYKLGTMSKVFKIAGKDLSNPLKSKKSIIGTTDEKQKTDAQQAGGGTCTKGEPYVYRMCSPKESKNRIYR